MLDIINLYNHLQRGEIERAMLLLESEVKEELFKQWSSGSLTLINAKTPEQVKEVAPIMGELKPGKIKAVRGPVKSLNREEFWRATGYPANNMTAISRKLGFKGANVILGIFSIDHRKEPFRTSYADHIASLLGDQVYWKD